MIRKSTSKTAKSRGGPFEVAVDLPRRLLLEGEQLLLFRDIKGRQGLRADESPEPLRLSQPKSSHRILVVDDDGDTRQLSVDILVGAGYDVEAVEDGAIGWKTLQANRYDLVITDNKMPKVTGLELIEKLRSAGMVLPVIMATRYSPTHEFDLKPWLRPDVALERPFDNDDLLAAVKKVLVRHVDAEE